MASTFILCKYIYLSLELRGCFNTIGLGNNLQNVVKQFPIKLIFTIQIAYIHTIFKFFMLVTGTTDQNLVMQHTISVIFNNQSQVTETTL